MTLEVKFQSASYQTPGILLLYITGVHGTKYYRKMNKKVIVSVGGEGAQCIRKISFLITPCNLQKGNPFCAEYMHMVIVYKQGT